MRRRAALLAMRGCQGWLQVCATHAAGALLVRLYTTLTLAACMVPVHCSCLLACTMLDFVCKMNGVNH